MENLNIIEIDTYIRLCDRRNASLVKQMTLYPGDIELRNEYEKNYKIIEKLEKEAYKKIDDLNL